MPSPGRFRRVAAILAVVLLTSCVSGPSLREQLESVPVKHLSFYGFDASRSVGARIGEAPQELVDLYTSAGETGLTRYEPTDRELAAIRDGLDRLPDYHRQVLRERLVAIYCLDNFGSSAMADYILGEDGEVYALLILHPRVLSMTASELLTYRANTCFAPDGSGTRLLVELEPDPPALDYLLLHEATHIADYADRHTPYVEPAMLELYGPSPRSTDFTDRVWTDYRRPAAAVDFPHQRKIEFYGFGGEPDLAASDIPGVLAAFRESPFPSLYGSSCWAEDFADFVTYHHLVNRRELRYAVRVEEGRRIVSSYEPMLSTAVADRAGLLDPRLFASADRTE